MEKLEYLIDYLLKENDDYKAIEMPTDIIEQKQLLRGLLNQRPPAPISEEFLVIQDEYLQAEIQANGVTCIEDLTSVKEDIYIFKGDITTLKVDGIVNACNSALLGCFHPNHKCIDNAIHTYAGVQLRNRCNELMQGKHEPTGKARITLAYNLPSKAILHTVGPIITGELTQEDGYALASCYLECLLLASKNGLNSIAFCCISTGEYRFPNEAAAKIAIKVVEEFLNSNENKGIKVIFNVFKEEDNAIYNRLLKGENQ